MAGQVICFSRDALLSSETLFSFPTKQIVPSETLFTSPETLFWPSVEFQESIFQPVRRIDTQNHSQLTQLAIKPSFAPSAGDLAGPISKRATCAVNHKINAAMP